MIRNYSVLGAALLTMAVANSPVVASGGGGGGGGSSTSVSDYLADQASRPDNASLRINSSAIDHIDDRFIDFNKTAKAGVESSGKEMKQTASPAVNEWFRNPTVYAEYGYINSTDKRIGGADSNTNSATIGFDFMTKYDILTGIIYSYSNRSAAISPAGFPTDEDSHFISLYVAKSFWQWVSVGVSGGYGYTSTETLGVSSGNEDTWDVAPFVSVSHSWGAFSASLTTSYIQSWSNMYGLGAPGGDTDNETGKLTVGLKLGYAVTEKLRLQATAKYTGVTDREPTAIPEARNWATFGTKATYRIVEHLDAYAGYAYDAFNTSYRNHNLLVGVSYSW